MDSVAVLGRALPTLAARPRLPALRAAVLAVALLAGTAAAIATPRVGTGGLVRVVVRALPGQAGAAAAALRASGGVVGTVLAGIDEVVGIAPAGALSGLSTAAGVAEVTEDAPLHLQSSSFDPATDVGSMASTARISGAGVFWQAGFTGQGVDIAVIDSGVAPVDGLAAPGKVVFGPDLSSESQSPATADLDTFGHGTHVAGIIAGRDDAAVAPYADAAHFTGIAPDARLVSIKVADAHGSTEVSQVIAAIDWVVQHRDDRALDIRVLNLSFGTESAQPWRYDPLAYAAEAAWRHGIVVVVAAGNGGAASDSLNDPAYDPNLLAVGAADTQGTLTTADDTVASFSSTGRSRHPDLVAPGVHVVSLRDPGSYVDRTFAATGAVGDRFFRGSGTSQAAAVVSGAAALVLSQRPELTPDQVKALLVRSAQRLHGEAEIRQGAGELDLARALTARTPRGSARGAEAAGTGAPEGSGGDGSDNTWSGNTWSGNTWSGNTWSGNTWSGNTWSGDTWSGNTWSGNTWSGNTWSADWWG